MIGLDTNILVRLVVADDVDQSQRAQRFVDENCTRETPAFINCVVIAELVWVLARSYGYSHTQIVDVIASLLDGDDRVVEHRDAVIASLEDYKTGKYEFVDAFILHINGQNGCTTTATFDRKAARNPGYLPI
ncbi:PIN domain-containing protein [Pseudorhodoplanes sp.]|uniref:PIN domain-containing protein n=1 Tax=Pseudorhodoplanes sp. TaxID=1934341 RepID=UPI003D118860